MLFILSFFIIFVNGGITGVMVATMPFDWQVQDTYFVVAHFHHVLIGGAVLPLLAGLYHWLPKVCGRMFNVIWGKLSVALIFAGFNLTFIPLYIAGLYGMRRRVYTFHEEMGVGTLNFISTIGAYILAAGFALALFNLLWGYLFGRKLQKDDPWGCGTLEWSVTSPPPNAGFNAPPVVRDRYPVWQQEAGEVPGDSYTETLKSISNSFAFRPSGWRATLLTDVTNARPQAVQFIPGSTLLPFFLSVAILVTTVAVLGKSYITASVGALVSAVLTGWWMAKNPKLPKEETDLLESQSILPLESDGSRDLGWWGMIGTLIVLLMFLGTLVFSYFYIRLYSSQWPQDLLPLPDYVVPAIAAGVLLTGVFTQWLCTTARKKESRSGLITFTALNILIGTGFIILLSIDLYQTPFSMTFNTYCSLFYTIRIFLLLLFLTALSLQTGVFLRLVIRGETPQRPQLRLWLQNTEMFWFVSILYIFIGFFVIYVTPYLR
jgi:cytochrome c oxidase subunit I+III